MSKVLLVIEDFSELKDLETVLRKLGFDVVGIASEFSMAQQILTFNPDIVIGSGQGAKVSAMGVGRRLREMPRWVGHTILGFPKGFNPPAEDLLRIRMDNLCESPLNAEKVLPFLARIEGQDEKKWAEKLKVVRSNMAAAEANRQEGGGDGSESDIAFVSGGFSKFDEASGTSSGFESKSESEAFISPDIKAVEEELATLVQDIVQKKGGKESPKVGPKAKVSDIVVEKTPEKITEKLSDYSENPTKFWGNSIEKANEVAKSRLSKALVGLKDVKLAAESTLTRKKTRKALKEMVQDWDPKELENQDRNRREFTRFLFKKK